MPPRCAGPRGSVAARGPPVVLRLLRPEGTSTLVDRCLAGRLLLALSATVAFACVARSTTASAGRSVVERAAGYPSCRRLAVAVGRPLPKPHPVVCPLAPGSTALLPAPLAAASSVTCASTRPSRSRRSVQRRAASRLLARLRLAARGWQDARAAARDGFATARVPRRSGDLTVHYLHAEHRRFSADRRFLDPRRPESLIYANAPGRPLVLVGLMFSVRRGMAGPTPGGPLTRWHSHLVCVRGTSAASSPAPTARAPSEHRGGRGAR